MKDDLGLFYFHQGTNYYAYKYLGSHILDGKTVFRVWAPNALKVSVVGDFNNWDRKKNPMNKISDGVWEAVIEDIVKEFDCYQYAIKGKNNRWFNKSDPYAKHFELRPKVASKVYELGKYEFTDSKWMKKRNFGLSKPMNIYELNLGSWRTYEDGNFFDYRKIALELVEYIKQMGYTHIELMPINEFPFDKSWGYQVTGFFGITSRYGTPDDFRFFVDTMHNAGIGVIVDWVPGHFCKDAHGLYEFDGGILYEHPDPTRREHKGWGTRCFDYGRNEIQSFLVSSAIYLLEEYHIDGLRVDAVSSMLYLDYCREPGEWHPNNLGTNINLEAVAFIQKLNATIHKLYPRVITIAEEATTYPNITGAPVDGGLGFDYKWNMGWMNDTLSYVKIDPIFKQYDHHKLTFQLTYAFTEKFILPLSHDEVVHGKLSIINRMPGTYEEKFAGLKAYMMYMISTPGKKLMFMGGEIGQFIEWRDDREIDWLLLAYDSHQKIQKFNADLNHFYKKHSELYEIDDSWDGFSWINANDANHNIYSYKRKNKKGKEIIVVLNFSNSFWDNYYVYVEDGDYEILFHSDDITYGGARTPNKKKIHVENGTMILRIPPLCGIYLRKVK